MPQSPDNSTPVPFWNTLLQHRRFYLGFLAAGLILRLVFYFRFPHITGDSIIYGDIAKNWLTHGIYGLTHAEGVRPTWIRLPGYPAFLVACFVLFGREHYHAVLLLQIAIDLVGCFVISDMARRTVLNGYGFSRADYARSKESQPASAGDRPARLAFAVAALCPFTANYTVAPLAETLSIFFSAIALDAAIAAFQALDERRSAWRAWIATGLALAAGILLRPDGGILLAAIGLYLLWRMWRQPAERRHLFAAGTLLLVISLVPLVPWTIRNWRDFHRFQPLAPRYASDPDEFVPTGFDKWMRTWIVDYASTEEVYWQVPGSDVDLSLLPSRACDNQQQCDETHAIFDEYVKSHFVGPELNQRFEQLADQRIRGHRFRYYVRLPVMRIADMWLRPRTEMLPLDSRWWEYADDTLDCVIATFWGVVNLLLVLAAVMCLVRGPRPRYLGLMLLFIVLRSLFLGTLENPEPRYTLECFPVVLVLGGAWLSGWRRKQRQPELVN